MAYRFRDAREKAGLSTLEVAKRIGVSQPAVTNWDNGTKSPSIDTLCKLADLYCVSTDYLLGRDEQVESIPRKEDITERIPHLYYQFWANVQTVMTGEKLFYRQDSDFF